jgi:hypothetical protein
VIRDASASGLVNTLLTVNVCILLVTMELASRVLIVAPRAAAGKVETALQALAGRDQRTSAAALPRRPPAHTSGERT